MASSTLGFTSKFIKMSDYIKKVKFKIVEVRSKPWAEPTAMALKVTGKIVKSAAPFPGSSLLGGAFSLGAAVLNPDPSLADLKRSEQSICSEIIKTCGEISKEMEFVSSQAERVENKLDEVLLIVTDIHYLNGIKEIAAAYQVFLQRSAHLDAWNKEFNGVNFQTIYVRSCNVNDFFTYMRIISNREGPEVCKELLQMFISTSG